MTLVKTWFLRLHRWLALIFAVPLLVVITTGLVLSFEPWVTTGAVAPGSLSLQKVQALIAQHDPGAKARAIVYRSYDHALTINAGRGGGTLIDVDTGQVREPSALALLLSSARGLHERLMIDAEWLVVTSSAIMLALALLGILMGWPRLSNSLAGWHKGIAFGLLPLIVLSPLTGLLMSAGITFTTPSAAKGAPLSLAQALESVSREHDLSALIWLRPRGGQMLARFAENGEYRVYTVTADGATPVARNWPRLWHEGNFAGAWSSLLNAIVSAAILTLLVTGVWIWVRRQVRRRARRSGEGATQPAFVTKS